MEFAPSVSVRFFVSLPILAALGALAWRFWRQAEVDKTKSERMEQP